MKVFWNERVLEIWLLIIQLKKSKLGCPKTYLAEASWLSTLSIWLTVLRFRVALKIQLLLSARNLTPRWGKSKAVSFSEDTYMWYMWHVLHYYYLDFAMYLITLSVQLHIHLTCNKLYGKLCSLPAMDSANLNCVAYRIPHSLQRKINKAHKWNAVVTSYLPNIANEKLKLKYQVPRNSLLNIHIYLRCFLLRKKLLFIPAIAKRCNFINIVKKCRNFSEHIFWEFVRIFDKSKLCGVRLNTLHLKLFPTTVSFQGIRRQGCAFFFLR